MTPVGGLPGPGTLAAMPLHAVTTMYGEAGLRVLLAAELPALGGPDGSVAQALGLAAELHARDRRQSEPYLNHVLRVALRIIRWGIHDPEVTAAALLHDSVEDHVGDLAPGGRSAALGVLAARFGPRTAALVAAVTNPPREPGTDRHEQYQAHVADSLEASPWARVIKLSDYTDNAVGLMWTSGPVAVRLARKYQPLAPVLAGLATRPDTPLPGPARERVLRQLAEAGRRFTAILEEADEEEEP